MCKKIFMKIFTSDKTIVWCAISTKMQISGWRSYRKKEKRTLSLSELVTVDPYICMSLPCSCHHLTRSIALAGRVSTLASMMPVRPVSRLHRPHCPFANRQLSISRGETIRKCSFKYLVVRGWQKVHSGPGLAMGA